MTEQSWINDGPQKDPGLAFGRLIRIMARLRAEDGCPWDRDQTLATLRSYLVEETYEVLDALDHGSIDDHREELGDLLLQVVFQSQIRSEEGAFDAAAVANAISDKLLRRHPHVFGDTEVSGAEDVVQNWEAIKAKEKKGRRSRLDGVPRNLPALLRAERIQGKASRAGFDWPDAAGPTAKVEEEWAELTEARTARNPAAVEHELGDVLFSVVNLARHLGVSPEDALRSSIDRFEARFRRLESELPPGRADPVALDEAWEKVKKLEEEHRETSPSTTVFAASGPSTNGSSMTTVPVSKGGSETMASIRLQCMSCSHEFELKVTHLVERPNAIKCPSCGAKPAPHRARALSQALDDFLSATAAIQNRFQIEVGVMTVELPSMYGAPENDDGDIVGMNPNAELDDDDDDDDDDEYDEEFDEDDEEELDFDDDEEEDDDDDEDEDEDEDDEEEDDDDDR